MSSLLAVLVVALIVASPLVLLIVYRSGGLLRSSRRQAVGSAVGLALLVATGGWLLHQTGGNAEGAERIAQGEADPHGAMQDLADDFERKLARKAPEDVTVEHRAAVRCSRRSRCADWD